MKLSHIAILVVASMGFAMASTLRADGDDRRLQKSPIRTDEGNFELL